MQQSDLTQRHREAQLRLRAIALRDFILLWPLWDGSDRSFTRLVNATLPLVRANFAISASLGLAYYESLRLADRARGRATPKPAALDEAAIGASLYITGRNMTAKALDAGASPQDAMRTALVRTSGAVGRHVMAGGRDSLIESVRADDHARGYRRIVSPGACAFCRGLASGVTHDDFPAHDHCACQPQPAFS